MRGLQPPACGVAWLVPKRRATQAGTYFISTTTSQRRSLFHLPDWAAVVEDKIVQDRD
jgi:hypothetical protein